MWQGRSVESRAGRPEESWPASDERARQGHRRHVLPNPDSFWVMPFKRCHVLGPPACLAGAPRTSCNITHLLCFLDIQNCIFTLHIPYVSYIFTCITEDFKGCVRLINDYILLFCGLSFRYAVSLT